MQKYNLNNMVKGWFVGDFEPTLFKTQEVEVAVKIYKEGDREDWHYHKIATEITVVTKGEIEMCGQTHKTGDIIVLKPGEGTSFKSLTDSITTVVKIPGAKNDKYLSE